MVRASDYYSEGLGLKSQLDLGFFFQWMYFSLSQQNIRVPTITFSKQHQASEFQHLTWLSLLGLMGGLRVTTGPLKVAKFSQIQFSPALRVRISWNSVEASRQCCLCSLSSAPLPGRSKWLNGKSI